MNRRLMLISAAALLGAAGLSGHAAAALSVGADAKFAALSLIGDSINVVTFQPTLGSKMDRNIKQSAAITNAPFDVTALRAIQASVKQAMGAAEVLLYRSPSIELFGDPWALFDGSKLVLPPDLVAAMKKDGASHLLLLTRNRQDAKLATTQGSVGSGRLEGIGFYVDRQKRMNNSATQESGIGFLAPYTYLQLSLVDLSNAQVLQQQSISSSQTIGSPRSEDGFDPWKALSPEEKVSTLERMIEREVGQTVLELIKPN
ncbi:hypothetical protein [Roseateles oligotrophus]|uniref:Uncharacterized protein n=1 Tax=Roseateles oligotrophus TaxID=1769250 RepID=A0ABT2YJH7_9BURK|nr:hypothetical protein [Roseateles oligotrophus]MCV2370111.1 hypothetical protein [Roseateles oligotrophus]